MDNPTLLLRRRETTLTLQIKTITRNVVMLEVVTEQGQEFVLNLQDLVIETVNWLKRKSYLEVNQILEMEFTILKLIRQLQSKFKFSFMTSYIVI